jgi:hypothetical protein
LYGFTYCIIRFLLYLSKNHVIIFFINPFIYNNPGCDDTNVNAHGFNYCKGFWCFAGGGTKRSTLVHQLRDGHTRILNFSNPNVQVGGGATGTSTENNATQVSSQFLTVANFRAGNTTMLVGMTGLGYVPAFSTQTWEADVRCGTPGFTFQWATSSDGIDFTPIGSGATVTFTVGNSDFFIRVIVTDANGQVGETTMPVTIDNGCSWCPQELKVPTKPVTNHLNEIQISAFPNPANDNINFKLMIPSEYIVKLEIIDYLGKVIQTVQNEKLPKGEYNAEYNTSALPSGVYMYRLIAGDQTITKKIIISH